MGFRNPSGKQKALINSTRQLHGWYENLKNGQKEKLRKKSKKAFQKRNYGEKQGSKCRPGMGVGVANGKRFPGLKKPAKQVHLS